ncbi:O-antigen ligase family protein [Microbacterium nymphoidis]|uniref:O-antigen ligase family protein n=1 Tax=Microbacterium nymphoidis TaxID=2898586 RepID=UPI001E3E2207|nr:O-antigen ligase family protein [Microbacterium nymphoidis]MCD2499751.1 O-antigen ligase family protein [Microbacterium nymphoidis]
MTVTAPVPLPRIRARTRADASAVPLSREALRSEQSTVLIRAHAAVVVFAIFCAPAFDRAAGTTGAALVFIALAMVTALLWIPRLLRPGLAPAFPWRRLPWIALAYLAWGAASTLWTSWLPSTLLTFGGMIVITMHGLFLASSLSWRELVQAFSRGLEAAVGLSLVFELFVSLVVRAPLPSASWGPVLVDPEDPKLYWSQNLLLEGGRIQGIVGNANLLAMICLMAMLVFAVRFADDARVRVRMAGWFVIAAYLFIRCDSATAWVCAFGAVLVLVAVLAMRRVHVPAGRGSLYALFLSIGGALVVVCLLFRDELFQALGRSSDLTGRRDIWREVLARASQHPLDGWGFASPWVPWDPGFRSWILERTIPVMQAHNMWVDVFFQLGLIGVFFIGITYAAFTWRAWFFAIDRPRWDARADRPYRALSVLPALIVAVLLVQGLTESNPIMLWGWLCVITFAFKIKSAPLVGEQGDPR